MPNLHFCLAKTSFFYVSFNNKAATISDEDIQKVIEQEVSFVNSRVRKGDKVRINSGPFFGYEAVVEDDVVAGSARLLIQIMGRQSSVEIHEKHIDVV